MILDHLTVDSDLVLHREVPLDWESLSVPPVAFVLLFTAFLNSLAEKN